MAKKNDSFLENILFNIVFPVIILNKAHVLFDKNGALYSLLLALSLPFFYGLKDFIQKKKINFISAAALIGVGLTGIGAVLNFSKTFFSLKEALIPSLIGITIIVFNFLNKPIMKMFLFQSSLFREDILNAELQKQNKEKEFLYLMKKISLMLAGMFFLSGVLNFCIAIYIFKDIDPNLSQEMQSQILNQQIADMTWLGYVIIALPLTVVLILIFVFLNKSLKKMIDLDLEQILQK